MPAYATLIFRYYSLLRFFAFFIDAFHYALLMPCRHIRCFRRYMLYAWFADYVTLPLSITLSPYFAFAIFHAVDIR